MKQTTFATLALAALPLATALPAASGFNQVNGFNKTTVHFLATGAQVQNGTALHNAPKSLPADTKTLLDKYQPLSKAASDLVGATNKNQFPIAGNCFTEYPCDSVTRVSTSGVDPKKVLSDREVSALIDQIIAGPTVTFDQSDSSTIISGLKKTSGDDGATILALVPEGSMDAKAFAGMVWDMYKAAAPTDNKNPSSAIRATQAMKEGQQLPDMALCLYSSSLEGQEIRNFCMGRDGSIPDKKPSKRSITNLNMEKRSGGLLGGFCDLVKVPLLCSPLDLSDIGNTLKDIF